MEDYQDYTGDYQDERDQFEEEYGSDCLNCGAPHGVKHHCE